MKIKQGFIVKKVGSRYVGVAIAKYSHDFKAIINLNETGKYLWDQLLSPRTEEELTDALLAEYDTTREQAQADVRAYIQELSEAGILEE